MAIEKNIFKVARFNPEYHSPNSRDTMSSDDEEFPQRNTNSAVESDDDDDEFEDCDSGAGSDDYDLLELGDAGEEFCQVGDQTCRIPCELYDLSGLKDVLSMEVWNEVLTEEERFTLAKYLPDMDQENFVCTLKELFYGENLHFGSPIDKLFDLLKGGLCEPRVALYRQSLNLFQKKKHCHYLRNHHNAMVASLCQIRDAWLNCKGYSIEEKLRVLNIMKSQKSLMNENMEELGTESSDREESGDAFWGKKVKDQKLVQKTGRFSGYGVGPSSDISACGQKSTVEPAKQAKHSARGTLKLAGRRTASTKDMIDHFPPTHPGVEMKSGHYGMGLPVSQYNKAVGYDSSAAVRMNKQVAEKPSASKFGKKHESVRGEVDIGSFMGLYSGRNELHSLGRNKGINQLSDIKVLTAKPSYEKTIDGETKFKYNETLQQYLMDGRDPAWLSKQNGGLFLSGFNAKMNKGKKGREFVDLNGNDRLLNTEYRAKELQDKFGANSLQNRRGYKVGNRGIKMSARNEDTESDSSEEMDEDEEDNPLMRSKWAYPGGVPDLKYGLDLKKTKLSKRVKKDSYVKLDRSSQFSEKNEDYCENMEMVKAEQKGKMHDVGYLNNFHTEDFNKKYFPGPANVIDSDLHQFYPLGRNGNAEGNQGSRFHMRSFKPALDRRLKGEPLRDFSVPQSNYMRDYNLEDDLFWTRPLAAEVPFKLGKNGQMVELSGEPHHESSDISLMGCSTLSKKRKVMDDLPYMDLQDNVDYLNADPQRKLDGTSTLRKRGKNKLVDASDALENEISEPSFVQMETEDVEAETKPQKKQYPLITPTVLSGFSFSIIHLLSAVRIAMITLLPEDSTETGKHVLKSDAEQESKEQDNKQDDSNVVNTNSGMDFNPSILSSQGNVPSLAVQEIVNRVRSNPGDPCILETQEPLQDLVRGVLKIFSSRTAPLGAKGWKPLVVYEKSSKSWSWIGPLSHNLSDSEAVEEVTSPDAWGLPHKMLVKLVDSFANWLKNSQEALQQIGSLPAPPLTLMQVNLDVKERFKDLRAQKSLSTISPSSEEVRAYFRKEEVLRYLIPDRAFSYTAVDGKKSIVAPLRRCGGKPTSKARDHFMLKRDRPPHVTILCLVRDAAARLPDSIGTRADVCTLIRDSQYIVEDVSDAQVNQVVSGALDRLHYERDPCVQFDGERKLWVYLHREREEEDFEDDGTSSTKKWRRQKKEAAEPSEQGDVTVAYPGHVEQPGFDLVSDLNVEASCADDDKRSEPDYTNGNDQAEDQAETSQGSDHATHRPSPLLRNGLGSNSAGENKLVCQENFTNEDFDEENFCGDLPE